MRYACLLQYVVKKVSTFSSLNKVSNKILRVIFLLSILRNRSDGFFFVLTFWTLLVKREVLQNSSEQTPDLGVDQNSNLPCFYWLLRDCKGNWVKFVLPKQSHGLTRPNSTTSTRPSPFTCTVYCVLIGSTWFAQLVGYWSGTSLEVFKNNCG